MAADVQWYQNNSYVTVSLIIPAGIDKNAIKAQFEKEKCVVFESGSNKVLWESYLYLPVIPSHCGIKIGRSKRMEVKLHKEYNEQWSDLCSQYIRAVSSTTPNATPTTLNATPTTTLTTLNTTPTTFDTTPTISNAMPTTTPTMPNAMPATTPIVTPPFNAVPLSLVGNNTEEHNEIETDEEMFHTPPTISPTHDIPLGSHDLSHDMSPHHDDSVSFGQLENNSNVDLKHIQHDLIEKDNNKTVHVKLYVAQVIPQSCFVTFNKNSFIIQFKTINNQFLYIYPGSSSLTHFTWNVKLFGAIIPDQSKYSVKETYIELSLIKADPQSRWKTLERPINKRAVVNSLQTDKTTTDPTSDTNAINNLNIDEEIGTVKSPAKKTTMNFEFNPFMLTKKPSSPQQSKDSLPLVKPVSLITPYTSQSTDLSTDETPTEQSMDQGTTNPDMNQQTANPDTNQQTTNQQTTNQQTTNPDTDQSTTEQSTDTCQVNDINNPPPREKQGEISNAVQVKSFFRLSSDCFGAPSETGISNMGNTCFMSSILQALSNTIEVRDYFLGRKYKKELNVTNPLGCQGQLAECFFTLVDKLWSGRMQYISAKKIKDLVASKREQFSGYAQQDAHEFIMFFLDGLHEDLNRIKDKPYTPQVESNGRPDHLVSEESWTNYKKRNDSFFVDLFGGQFKSTLVCPECSKESVTFDPFMSLSVPIPQKSQTLSVIFFSKDPSVQPKEIVVSLAPESTFEILKASVATKLNISMKYLRMLEMGPECNLSYNKIKTISEIKRDDVIVMCEVVSYHETKEQVEEVFVVQRLDYPPLSPNCEECGKREEDLKRCGRCKSVGYCSRHCQEKDWALHKHNCKVNSKTLFGLPFVISLPITGLTYDNIMEKAQQYASWSVSYERRTVESSCDVPCPLFDLLPVDERGKTPSGATKLINKGKDTLTLSRKFVGMDWKNRPNQTNVTLKDLTVYKTAAKKAIGRESKEIRLEDCLQLFTEPETLPKDNAWYCPVCKEHREATKRLCVSRLPPVLIIHLKRFSFSDYSQRNKIDKFVDFPLKGLDMGPFLHTDTGSSLYDLYATVNHYGAVFLGHYTAMVQSPVGDKTEWFCCDDENVTRVLRKKVVDKSAYLLFYRRRDLS